jgi:hypothetical protein
MRPSHELIPIATLAASIGLSAYMVVQLNAQAAVPTPNDVRNATTVEVRDAQNRVVLSGQFAAAAADDGDKGNVERVAAMTRTGADTDAAGEAEIEFQQQGATVQEVEFDGENLDSNARFTLLIDGQEVATATSDADGDVEIEVEVPIPGAANAAGR